MKQQINCVNIWNLRYLLELFKRVHDALRRDNTTRSTDACTVDGAANATKLGNASRNALLHISCKERV